MTARTRGDARDSRGRVIVPANSAVRLTVTELQPAKSKSAADGKLAFRVDGISIEGRWRKVGAEVHPVQHELRGRGITAGEVEKVGVGAAAGAIAGRVITGKTRGAVIGGVVGAAGGAAVAAQTASRDVVVKAGSTLVFTLKEPLVAQRE